MMKVQTGVTHSIVRTPVSGKHEIRVAGPARLLLRNFTDNGDVSLFNMSGKRIYRANIASHTTALVLPGTITSGTYIVCITQRNTVFQKKVFIP